MKPISASALKTYDGCPRRWAFRYIEGIEEPDTEAKSLGKRVHAEMEEWIKLGKKPNHPLALRLLSLYKGHEYFPSKATTTAEEEFVLTIQGIRWRGFTDFRRARQHDRARIVGDWKTTSDLKYTLRPDRGVMLTEEGAVDVQSTLYAAREFVGGAEETHGQWAYVCTKDEGKRLVEVQFDRSHVEDVYGGMHSRASEMLVLLRAKPKANDVPYKSSYCFAYRKPCPYAAACQRPKGMFCSTPQDLVSPEGADSMVDFLSKIRDSFPTAAEEDAPPPPPEDDEAPPPPAEESATDDPPPPPEDDTHEAEKIVIDYLVSQGRTPEAAKRAVTGEVESGFINPPEAAGKASYCTPEEAAAGEGVEAPAEKPKKGKGRPRKTKASAVEVPAELGAEAAPGVFAEKGSLGETVFATPTAEVRIPDNQLSLFGDIVEKSPIDDPSASAPSLEGSKTFEETIRDIVREELRAALRSLI